MTNEKKNRGEEEHIITQAEKDAWNRGRDDAIRNSILKAKTSLSPEKAVKLVRLFAELGDIHHTCTRLDVPVDEGRRILASFGISSIEDARRAVRSGIVAEYDNAKAEGERQDAADRVIEDRERSERLVEHNDRFKKPAQGADAANEVLSARASEAAEKNKRDRIRELISQGIDPRTNDTGLTIAIKDVPLFRSMVHHGVSALRRRFGGTKADIIREIKRLSPQTDIDLLRP